MTGIVDYKAGNIKSVERALDFLGAPYVLSENPRELQDVDRIIFPGVGDAAFAMKNLRASGFDSFLKEFVSSQKKLMGICLGSQIVFDFSEEGDVECLGLLKGTIRHFSAVAGEEKIRQEKLKIPHMGWNDLEICNGGSSLLEGAEKKDFYFVHSFVIQPADFSVVKATAFYGTKIPAAVEKDNISVFQFHPEKSGEAGLKILRNFVRDDLEKIHA